jgi:hypothetical protein
MKKNVLIAIFTLLIATLGFSQTKKIQKTKSKVTTVKTTTLQKSVAVKSKVKPDAKTIELRKKHEQFLKNSPFKKTLKLSEDERMELGLPPNKYFEMEWELTMNPETGRPDVEKLALVRKLLQIERKQDLENGRTPGDAADNNWVERGPNNVGGRTRAVMFDPNDPTNETVFAGGVSGGLWRNTNISNANSQWTRVNIPQNLAVSCIAFDPNNTSIFYIGTGESYVGGDVNGDGVWKSTNGGVTWTNIFGGISGPTTFQSASNITVNSPAGIAGTYVTYVTTAFGTAVTSPITTDVVLANDGTATPTLACATLTNSSAMNGKIALIRRGSCTFVEKVNAAQSAGAVAVIMMNNVTGQPIPMGGTDPTITIPSVMISKENGDLIEAALANGAVNITINPSGDGFTGNLVPGIQHVNDIKIRNNGGNSEIYVAAGDTFYSDANALTFMGANSYGLYKSTDNGVSWNLVNLPLTTNGKRHCPNNIEFGSDGKIYVATIKSTVFNDGGGMIFSSTDGNTFTQAYEYIGADRTQIAVSKSNSNTVYVLSELTAGGVGMKKTTNGFATVTDMTLPIDADPGIPANDFPRQQAFYDLVLKVDPTNDQVLYAGGINLFKSSNGGTSWTQISHSNGIYAQYVHADQHGITFGNGNSARILFGNDGGTFFSSNSGTTISERNSGYNVTQFVGLGVAPTTNGMAGDNFIAGAQDNGSQMFLNAPAGLSGSTKVQGGDGGICMFDQDGSDRYRITNYVYNQSINLYNYANGATRSINSESTSNGAFYAPMALDSSLDILYSDYTAGTTYQIRRYKNIKTGVINKTLMTNSLLTSQPTALTVSKYTTTSTTLLVGTRSGKLYRLTNADNALAGLVTWTDITGPAFVGSVSDIEYGASENEIFVTFHNYNVVSVWYTNNGGTTWQNKEGNLPDIPVKAFLKNPLNANEAIVGTELGIWFTNDFNSSSPNWYQSYNGMSNVKVTDLDLRNDNVVFAATYGRGVFSGAFTSTTLSNSNFDNEKAISIYPNPSTGIINVNIKDYSGKVEYSVFDINGRVVFKDYDSNISSQKQLNLGQLSKGIYIVKVATDTLNYSERIILK